jgi:hypothetical protein
MHLPKGLVMKQHAKQPPPYRVEALADEWQVSADLIRDGLRTGRIKGFRINRMWLIPHAEKMRIESGEAASANS